jgi:hypothetical protein
MELTLKRLKQAGVEPTLTKFLYNNIVTQVVVDCLLDNIEDLSRELDRLKRTNNALTAHLTDVLRKHPTPPINHSLDDKTIIPENNTDIATSPESVHLSQPPWRPSPNGPYLRCTEGRSQYHVEAPHLHVRNLTPDATLLLTE